MPDPDALHGHSGSPPEHRGQPFTDSAGKTAYSMEARSVVVGDEIVGGWRPGPIVLEIVLNDDGEQVLFIYEHDPDVPGGTKHTSPWMRLGETVLVWGRS